MIKARVIASWLEANFGPISIVVYDISRMEWAVKVNVSQPVKIYNDNGVLVTKWTPMDMLPALNPAQALKIMHEYIAEHVEGRILCTKNRYFRYTKEQGPAYLANPEYDKFIKLLEKNGEIESSEDW